MLTAIVRAVSPAISDCELTHLDPSPIDFRRAQEQHRQYVDVLAALGCSVLQLDADSDLPDSVFVEDTAVILDEIAVITRPGAESRRNETTAIAEALSPWRQLRSIPAPTTLDGGDVLRIGRTLYVGLSTRSSHDAAGALLRLIEPFGYAVIPVRLDGCLHLKTAVTEVAEGKILLNSAWVDPTPFASYERIEVDPSEPWGANTLRIQHRLVYPDAFPRTRDLLEKRGISVVTVEADELAKAEGGVTCCSLIFET